MKVMKFFRKSNFIKGVALSTYVQYVFKDIGNPQDFIWIFTIPSEKLKS